MNAPPNISFESRIRGAIFGALVGDALGVPVEFQSRFQRDADPVSDMRGWGTHHQPPGTWSDDGAMLLCTADAVVEGFSARRLADSYVQWMQKGHWAARGEVFDIGNTTAISLGQIANGVPLDQAGGASEDENGNGSLMRILPVGLRFHRTDTAELCRLASQASILTHAHRRSQWSCAFYCVAVAAILHGTTLEEAYRHAAAAIVPLVVDFPREKAVFARLLSGELPRAEREEIESSGYVIHTLEAALWCVHRHANFKDAVLAAVNLGADTDTTGCVAGGLAGAIHGFEAIPAEWRSVLPRRVELDTLMARFIPACR